MKLSFLLLPTVLVFASSTSEKYDLACLTSDKIIDVGNLDVLDAVGQHFHSTASDFGIISENEYRTSNMVCDGEDKDRIVKVNLEGHWGSDGEMRDVLLQHMLAFIKQAITHTTYDIYSDCMPGPGHLPSLRFLPPPREEFCGNGDCPCPTLEGELPIVCYGKMGGHKLPNKISIQNSEMELSVEFTTPLDDYAPGGCDMVRPDGDLLGIRVVCVV